MTEAIVLFNMEKTDSHWHIVPGSALPDWITKNEAVFEELIEEELKNI